MPLPFTMAVAIFYVHGPAGFWLPDGYEFTLVLLVSVLALGVSGPGALALQDRLFPKPSHLFTQEVHQTA